MSNLSRYLVSSLLKQSPRKSKNLISILQNTSRNPEALALPDPRCIHRSSSSSVSHSKLKSRGIVRLHGKDTVPFLQGLVTNDVNILLETGQSLQYSFMLNVQGRILYDLFIYDVTATDGSPTTFLIDVPVTAVSEFMALLRKYKLRKKVDIVDVSDELEVWSQFSPRPNGSVTICFEAQPQDTILCCPDPRVAAFGKRLIRKTSTDNKNTVEESAYRQARYTWGLPEGVEDLPPGNCFPLESNALFMNGVSFEKGCYIGQELTARTHYTGVTRKRLLPLVFNSDPPQIENDASIKTEKGRNAGKFRGSEGTAGLGLVRLAHSKDELQVTATDNSTVALTAHIPSWWPEFQT